MGVRSYRALPVGLCAVAFAVSALPGQAFAAGPGLSCVATMSNVHPTHNKTTVVEVKTSAYAKVSATAHYKTKATSHAAAASRAGFAVVPFDISMATVGYRVTVDVSVAIGAKTGHCTTYFTPVTK